MATIIDKGWLWLTNGVDTLKLAAEQVFWDEVRDPQISHYPGFSFGYDQDTNYYLFTVKRLYFDSHSSYDNFKTYVNTWQVAAPFTLKIQRASTGEFESPDGTYEEYQVLHLGMKKCYKVVNGDEEFYVVENMQFEEAGVRS